MPAPEPIAPESAAPGRWLAIVGIGEDGVDGLTPIARSLIEGAEIVFGGKRHLALAAPLIRGAVRPWPSPFDSAVDEVLAQRGRQICVLASGDPFQYGVGTLIAGAIPLAEIVIVPAVSAFSLAAARLGWPLPETAQVTVHGRALDRIRPRLQPGAHVLALTSDAHGPRALAGLLTELGFGDTHLTILEALGGPRERIRQTTAATFDFSNVDPLNLVALEVIAGPGARVVPLGAGLADDLFEHDGQITKREIRAITLSSLAAHRGELLWDVGAGAGSVAIEWLLTGPSLHAIAVEAEGDRARRIGRNAAAFGVPDLRIIEGRAPAALAGLPAPDAVFIGGGASDPGVLDAAVATLRSGGRLVVNAVTLETEAVLLARHAAIGGELTRIAVSRASPIGRTIGWRPAMPVTQWRWVKP